MKEKGEKAVTLEKGNMGDSLAYLLSEMKIQVTNIIIIYMDFTVFFPFPIPVNEN